MVLTLQYLTYVVLTCSLKSFILLMSHSLQVSGSRLLIWHRHMYYGTSHFDTSMKQFQWQQHFLTALTDIFQKTWFGIFNFYTTQIEINCSCSMATHLPPSQPTTERTPRYSHIEVSFLCIHTSIWRKQNNLCTWVSNSLVPRPPPFLPSVCICNSTWDQRKTGKAWEHLSRVDTRWMQGEKGQHSNM